MSRQSCSQYIAEVEKIIQYGGSRKETSIRFAFQKLLDDLLDEVGQGGPSKSLDGGLTNVCNRSEWGAFYG